MAFAKAFVKNEGFGHEGILTVLSPSFLPHGCPLLALALLALPMVPQISLLTSVPRSSEEVKGYLGQGGIAAVEVEVLAAVEGDGEGAAEGEHGGGLWEGCQRHQCWGVQGLRTH